MEKDRLETRVSDSGHQGVEAALDPGGPYISWKTISVRGLTFATKQTRQLLPPIGREDSSELPL